MLHVICNHVSARIYVSVFRRPGIAIYLKGQSLVCLSARSRSRGGALRPPDKWATGQGDYSFKRSFNRGAYAEIYIQYSRTINYQNTKNQRKEKERRKREKKQETTPSQQPEKQADRDRVE
jgi:hypothetical protein